MTIKNADKAAIPFQPYGIDGFPSCAAEFGLTKREMIAMHMMAANRSRHSTYSSWESMESDAVEAADALLAELERTK